MFLSSLFTSLSSQFSSARELSTSAQTGLKKHSNGQACLRDMSESLAPMLARESIFNVAVSKVESRLELSTVIEGILKSKMTTTRWTTKDRRGRRVRDLSYRKRYKPAEENLPQKMMALWMEEHVGDKRSRTLLPGMLMLLETLGKMAEHAKSLVDAVPDDGDLQQRADCYVSNFSLSIQRLEHMMRPVLRFPEINSSLNIEQATAIIILLGAEWRVGEDVLPDEIVPIEYDSIKTELYNINRVIDKISEGKILLQNNLNIFYRMSNISIIINHFIPRGMQASLENRV